DLASGRAIAAAIVAASIVVPAIRTRAIDGSGNDDHGRPRGHHDGSRGDVPRPGNEKTPGRTDGHGTDHEERHHRTTNSAGEHVPPPSVRRVLLADPCDCRVFNGTPGLSGAS